MNQNLPDKSAARTLTVDTATLLTISTGRYLVDEFDKFHAAADVLAGQSLMTNNFASETLSDHLAAEAKRQHSWLADPLLMDDFPELDGDRDTVKAALAAWVAAHSEKHGNQHVITSPPETRRVPLFEGLEHLGANRQGSVA